MDEQHPKKYKGPPPKAKMKKVRKEVEEEGAMSDDDFVPMMEQQQTKRELPLPPIPTNQMASKKAAPRNNKNAKFHSEPLEYPTPKHAASLPSKMPIRQMTKEPHRFEEQQQYVPEMLPTESSSYIPQQQQYTPQFPDMQLNDFPDPYAPLPPIGTTQNFNEIYQIENQLQSIKAFKDYFIEQAQSTGKIECDANPLLTDAHLYQLSQIDWPHLEKIRIRACPHITPYAKNYLQMLTDKQNDQAINVNVELMNHTDKNDLTDDIVTKLEEVFEKSTQISIVKVLIYHAYSQKESMLSSQQMIINQIQKSKENSPMLLNYISSTHDECQVAILECTNAILFKELCTSFHPHMIYMIVSNFDDVMKAFFSTDCQTSFSILQNQQLRLIINNNNQTEEQFLSNLHSQLKNISKSAHDIYSQFIDETPAYVSDNDDFRRNHYLSSLLHIQTKCGLLQKKLTKDHCLNLKQKDLSQHLIKDATKHSKIFHKFNSLNIDNIKEGESKISETHESIKKLTDQLINKLNEKKLHSVIRNSTKTIKIYFSHKLANDTVLDMHSISNGKSYFISDIEWFCRMMNEIFNIETPTHRKIQYIFEQFKQTIGKNIHMISKHDFKKLKIHRDEMDFFQWLFDSWNIAYSVSVDDNHVFILLNSISSEPPVPLNTVWTESWPTDEYESNIWFHFLHPCDASILFQLYKLIPSQKLLLASKNFLLIQDGAIEILIQYHQSNDISFTCRALNLNLSKDVSDKTNALIDESFRYVVREYYVIIWAYLFKNDYAFKIEEKNKNPKNMFEGINGNELMHNYWKDLALYHYSSSPTLTSTCSVCGLRPAANKSLYEACTTLSPARYKIQKNSDMFSTDENEDQSGVLIYELENQPITYTGKHSMRPDGCNSFEVIFLSNEEENELNRKPLLSSIQIGCLMNTFGIKDNEKILFEYGNERKKEIKPQDNSQASFLDEIRNFGGSKGLKGAKNKSTTINELQELYTGLRLRVDILFTHKSNTYEFIYSINGIPWSRQTIKRKSVQTMFMPIVQSSGNNKSDRKMNLIIYHTKSAFDTATIPAPISESKINPWKVGMRLEAKDRKNPSILAIANIIEVYEDNRVRINFDGWTSTFDYTVETDNPDLHPAGYWEYIQRVLYKNVNTHKHSPHFTFTRYDKPKSYDGPFSWRNYLTEIDQEPVPFECFNYLQTEGMTQEYFPHSISKTAFTRLSCRHYYNARVKYHKMNTFIQNEIVNKILCDHHMELSSPTAITSPGAVLLPTPFDRSNLLYPCLKQFQNSSNFVVHLTCNHRSTYPLDAVTIVSGTHLLDTQGNRIEKTALNMSLITICMLTAIDLARNQVRPIAPSTSKLISNNDNSLDKNLINFYIRRWLDLSAYITCFYSTEFYSKRPSTDHVQMTPILLYTSYCDQDLFVALKSGLNSIRINSSQISNIDKEYQFGKYGECYYCCLFRADEIKDKSDISFQKRIEIIGNYAPSIFYLELYKQEKSLLENRLILNDEFFIKFSGLEIIDISNMIIDQFRLNNKNIYCLKNLSYLALENNDLTMIYIDFKYLNKLAYLKLKQNPFQSLPLNCFLSKSLQQVDLCELGRLAEIDPNTRFSLELKNLSITDSILTALPSTLGIDGRAKLTKLTLNGVAWWGVDGISVNEVVKYDSFTNKFTSYLDNDELLAIYRMYDEDMNGVLTYNEINPMNAHIYRYIPRLRPSNTKIPGSGRSSVEPTNTNESDIFKQESFSSDSSGFPSVIFYLENLVELTLEYQGIKFVPDAIKNLKYLTIFNLNYCIELETLSAQVGYLPLKELNLTGCVSLKTPPIEITRRGHTQTMAFLQRLGSGSTPCKRTKLMLVGLGGAGKTSLVRAFLASHNTTPPQVTDGIDILKWKVPLNDPDDFLEFSVWDFAGQSVYYHTHQFFLAKKAVYVLAWNIRLGAEHAGLDFWLSSICCHAPNAPIFVVGTHSDQVSRFDLRQDDLKRRYPQIAGFFNVSTYTGDQVHELTESIIKTTLALPYMDEQIPKAWLNFEKLIGECDQDILTYNQVTEIAQNAGVFEPDEVLQAVQFLHDLGSLQYFSSEHLKNYVVINPQWIVNVMACIVSIKDSPVKNGRLLYSDIGQIWRDYAEHLHPWILKLTEAFDLTFPVPDQNMNLVPCLLPEDEPEYTWLDDISETDMKEMKVIYTFNYLPAGLFNRAQVRLFQFSDKSTIWRYGSLLVKNNHRAVIMRTDDRHIVIKIQGVRPDNILFLIHEVFEGLVNESFFGVTYDIAFPCPDCVELRTNDPWQFSSSLINRAIELKSPSIQCHRFFHVASVTDLQALVPPDSKSNYDLHLEYSVRDLKSYKQNMAVDIVYIYPAEHIPTASEINTKVDPRKIKDDLTKRGLALWSPDSMKEFKIENHYLVVKEARFIIFGISTELIQNPSNKNLYDAYQTIVNILRKPIIPVLFGTDMKWKESDIGVELSDKLYVSMQNPKRYEHKILELIDLIEQERKGNNKTQQSKDEPTDVFISYCWSNSHDAINKGTKPTATSIGWGDPRALKDYLEGRGLRVWMDITRLGKSGVLHDIVQGLKNTKLVVACVSDEYTQSEVCRNEFLFAKNTLRLPVMLGIFGCGDKWRTTEVGMCSLTCPQVNFQFENPTAFEDIFNHIQSNLPKRPSSAKEVSSNAVTTSNVEETTTAAYQELFELTQRKFLRLISGFADTMTARAYPRLFALDFMGEKEKSAQELARIEMATEMNAQRQQQQENDNERDLEAERQRDEEVRRKQEEAKAEAEVKTDEKETPKKKQLCIRALCEYEENWHSAGNPFDITEKFYLLNSASYLSRIMLLLKHSDLALEILNSDEGEIELQKLAEDANNVNTEVKESYAYLRRCIMDCDPDGKYAGLKQCLMPSGKVLWLCEEHQKLPRVVLVTGSVAGGYTRPQAEEKSEIVKALAKLNERIANNELPAPTLKVPTIESAPRSSSEKQSTTPRYSRRISRQESVIVKSHQPNMLEIDENTQENGDEDFQRTVNGIDNDDKDQKQEDEAVANTTDCSIM